MKWKKKTERVAISNQGHKILKIFNTYHCFNTKGVYVGETNNKCEVCTLFKIDTSLKYSIIEPYKQGDN